MNADQYQKMDENRQWESEQAIAEHEADQQLEEAAERLSKCCCGMYIDPGCSVHGWE